MNRIVRFAIYCFAVVILFALTAHAELEKNLLGKWLNASQEETMEFLEDGTMIVVAKGKNAVGDYKFLDDERIRVDMGA